MRRCLWKYAFLLSLLITTSCLSDQIERYDDPDMPEITVNVRGGASAYMMTNEQENQISEVDVLMFRIEEGTGREVFAYRSQGWDIRNVGSTFDQKQFKVRLRKDTGNKYRLVIIANARKPLNDMGMISTTATKAEVLPNIISGDLTDPDTYHSIPMWGESEIVPQVAEGLIVPEIKIVRAMARVDVVVSPAATSSFVLEEVYLFNRNRRGRVTPVTDETYWDAAKYKALKPSLPADPMKDLGPLAYLNMATATELRRAIYIYEAAAAGEDKYLDAICLVVGGSFNGNPTSYYRIDFTMAGVEIEDEGSGGDGGDDWWGGGPPGSGTGGGGSVGSRPPGEIFAPIRRNYIYEMSINSVSGNGYESPKEAFESKTVNMVADITTWSMLSMSNVDFGGEEILRVSQSFFSITGAEYTDIIDIYNTNSRGWSASTSDSWLQVVSKTSEKLTFKAERLTSGQRTGYIYIRAGNLTKRIRVYQYVPVS